MIYLTLGRREQGKTTLNLWMLRRGSAARAIFDPRGLIGPFGGERIVRVDDVALAFVALDRRELVEVVYTPAEDVALAFHVFARELADWVRRDRARPLRVLIDEAGFVPLASPEFLWLLRCSQRDRVDVFITAHRPVDIPTDVRAIADHWLMFPMRQEHDLRVVSERCGSAIAARVEGLAPHQAVWWDDSRCTWDVLADPTTWYLDLEGGSDGRG